MNSSRRTRVVVVIGTRPEAIKMFPVIQALNRSDVIRPYVVLTGQHEDMVRPVLEMAGVQVDADLEVGPQIRGLNGLVPAVMRKFDDLLASLRLGRPERRTRPRMFNKAGNEDDPYPAATLVHGDTSSALGTALASAGVRLPVIHVESGLRTGDRLSPFPEEMNRQILGRIATLHLAPTASNLQNLIQEGVDIRDILITGNTGLDALRFAAGLAAPWPDERLEVLDRIDGPVIAVTAHRRENWGAGIRGIAEGVAGIARARIDCVVVWPMHPNPAVRAELIPIASDIPNVLLVEPMEYAPFARLLARATLALTDSGGIQEEAQAVHTPVLVTRANSERPEGIDAGFLRLVGSDPIRIMSVALDLLSDSKALAAMQNARNPFGDGHAAERIRWGLEHLITGAPSPVPFSSGFSRRHILESAGYSDIDIDIDDSTSDTHGVGPGRVNLR